MALGIGTCSAVVSLSVFPGSTIPYRMNPQPIDPPGIEMDVRINPNSDSFDSVFYMKDGKWDMDKLREKQEEYFEFIRTSKRTGKFYSLPNAVGSFMPVIDVASKKYGVRPDVIASIIQAESFGYTYAIGNDGEMGLMQIDPNKHPKEFRANYSRIFEPKVNIDIGTSILKDYLVEFHGNYRKAIEAYNAGEHSVISGRLMKSTREYVGGVMLRCNRPMIPIRR